MSLLLAWDCERYGALPDAGGVYDQDHYLMEEMSLLMAFYSAHSTYRTAKGHQIHNLSNNTRKVLRRLEDLGVWDG